jgi:outer membrane protein assembly factor BamB
VIIAGVIAADETVADKSAAAENSGLADTSVSEGLIASPEAGWPQWRGPRRDGISTETGLLPSWPAGGPRRVWQVGDLGRGWSSPVAMGERLYVTGDVGDDLVIFAYATDGSLLWRVKNGKSWQGSYPGARACCVLSDGRLYHLNAHGRLACLDPATGDELWAANILERFDGENITWALSECLLVDGPRVIVTPGGKKALMAALDKTDGRTVWTTPPLGTDRTSHSSPILFRYAGRRLIANCSSGHGFGVDADSGKLLWTVPLKNRYGVNTATPIYGAGCVFYVTPYAENGRLYRLRANASGVTAERVWTSLLDTVTGSGVLLDGTLYAAGYRRSKWWFGVDWETGRTMCEQKDLTTGAAIFADGRLYVLDESGTVGLMAPRPSGLELAGRFRLLTERKRDAWAHPILHEGRLYLRYHDKMWCYDVKKKDQ